MPPIITLKLPPNRRRMAASMRKLFDIIANSDNKQYARGKPFTPIFPTDDATLQAAITTVYNQLTAVLGLD